MNKRLNIEYLYSNLEKLEKDFSFFIEKNEISNKNKNYIIEKIEEYKKELIYIKTTLLLSNKNSSHFEDYSLILEETQSFTIKINEIIH